MKQLSDHFWLIFDFLGITEEGRFVGVVGDQGPGRVGSRVATVRTPDVDVWTVILLGM